MTLVNMLSINVALFVVILVGRVIEGYKPILYIKLINSVVLLFSCGLSKSILKCLPKYLVVIAITEYFCYFSHKHVNISSQFPINAANKNVFLFFPFQFVL